MEILPLTQALVFQLSGKHAVRFLQNRVSNEIGALPLNAVCMAAALTPQGKVEGIFSILHQDRDSYLLLSDGGDEERIKAAILRFRVTEQVEMKSLNISFGALHVVSPSAEFLSLFGGVSLPAVSTAVNLADIKILPRQRFATPGFDFILPKSFLTEKLPAFVQSILSAEVGAARRIAAGIPEFPLDLNENTLLSETNVAPFVSFTKGCYVGQEVVAKIDALGKSPRCLIPFSYLGDKIPPVGTEVLDPQGKSVGRVTSTGKEGGAIYCFVSLKNDPILLQQKLTVQSMVLSRCV